MATHWYLVHTKPRQEAIALQNLEQQGYDCYLPILPTEKLQRGTLGLVKAPLFPRYLFIQLGNELAGKSWAPIRSTKGVSRLVCFGSEPAKVDDRLVERLKYHERLLQPQRLFAPGERVFLTEGAFANIEGVYQMADGESRVMVLIELMAKPVHMSVPLSHMRKAG